MATPLEKLLVEVVVRVAKITVFLGVGVGLANLAIEFGAVERITALAKPLTRPANLPPEVGTAILATTASPTAGYGMLAEYRESGLLDDRATLVAVTMNTFFGFAQHIFTFYAPVLIPILGLQAGLLYVGTRALIALAITLTGIAAGALLLSAANVDTTVEPDADATTELTDGGTSNEPTTTVGKLRAAGASTGEKLREILPRLAVVYLAVVVLVDRYDAIEAWLGLPDVAGAIEPMTSLLGLPEAAIPTVAVFAIDTTNGAIFLAPFLEEDVFTPRQAVATMLVGGIVSFAVTTFKRSIPFQYGIWGAEFGSKVILVNITLKIVFITLALVLLLAPL